MKYSHYLKFKDQLELAFNGYNFNYFMNITEKGRKKRLIIIPSRVGYCAKLSCSINGKKIPKNIEPKEYIINNVQEKIKAIDDEHIIIENINIRIYTNKKWFSAIHNVQVLLIFDDKLHYIKQLLKS